MVVVGMGSSLGRGQGRLEPLTSSPEKMLVVRRMPGMWGIRSWKREEHGPWGGTRGQAALAWSPCHTPSAGRRFLPQGVQTTPGQTRRISRRRTVLFGQCQAVTGLGMGEGQVCDQWWPFSADGRDIISGPGEWIGFLRPYP